MWVKNSRWYGPCLEHGRLEMFALVSRHGVLFCLCKSVLNEVSGATLLQAPAVTSGGRMRVGPLVLPSRARNYKRQSTENITLI